MQIVNCSDDRVPLRLCSCGWLSASCSRAIGSNCREIRDWQTCVRIIGPWNRKVARGKSPFTLWLLLTKKIIFWWRSAAPRIRKTAWRSRSTEATFPFARAEGAQSLGPHALLTSRDFLRGPRSVSDWAIRRTVFHAFSHFSSRAVRSQKVDRLVRHRITVFALGNGSAGRGGRTRGENLYNSNRVWYCSCSAPV